MKPMFAKDEMNRTKNVAPVSENVEKFSNKAKKYFFFSVCTKLEIGISVPIY